MKKMQILVVVSDFNKTITQSMLEACLETLYKAGIGRKQVAAVHVPGAFEIPLIASKAAKMNRWDAVICLGCVIKGETPHFDYVCQETARGIMDIGIQQEKPVIFGVLTTNTSEQAQERSGLKKSSNSSEPRIKQLVENKGIDSANAAIDMLKILHDLDTLEP